MKKLLNNQFYRDILPAIVLTLLLCGIAWFSSIGAAYDMPWTWDVLIYLIIPGGAILYACFEAWIECSLFLIFPTELLYCMGCIGYLIITFNQSLNLTMMDFVQYCLLLSVLFYSFYILIRYLKERREKHDPNSGNTSA